ncbi:hypothetical protein [Marinomonas shanghaiensis]|uniref:hypothetical protein n=1 Tax=Marinomonas shanghaiensis TaxID=2202418 RepID=UPI003A9346BB
MTGFKMNINTRAALVCLFLVLSSQAFARGDIPIKEGASFLVEACLETVEIFDKHSKARLLAGQRTSLNEGIKAGYCIGMTKLYREHAYGCNSYARSWFQMAEVIAGAGKNLSARKLNSMTTSELLEEAYCGL